MRWAGHEASMKKLETYTKFCPEELKGRYQFGKLRNRWEDNIGVDLRYEGVTKSFRTDSITKYMLTFGITH
jgi:hypothetical protein